MPPSMSGGLFPPEKKKVSAPPHISSLTARHSSLAPRWACLTERSTLHIFYVIPPRINWSLSENDRSERRRHPIDDERRSYRGISISQSRLDSFFFLLLFSLALVTQIESIFPHIIGLFSEVISLKGDGAFSTHIASSKVFPCIIVIIVREQKYENV